MIRSLLIILISLTSLTALAQKTFSIKGKIEAEATKETLISATVFIDSLKKGTVTNEYGYYEINLPEGYHNITFNLMGYEKQTVKVFVTQDIQLDIQLKEQATQIDEITITSEAEDQNISKTTTGLVTITKEEIEKLPAFLGESDPIKILQLMPGVQSAGEGNTGFYVRGGAVDQNLMVLDNSIVYNPTHLFGFFSVFNGSVVDQLDMYKGGIPSYLGGRLSSFTTIKTRPGDKTKTKGEGGIGIIAANALIEGPINKGKGSFMLAGRRSYIDLFMDPLRSAFSIEEQINYYFYDLNLNADYDLNANNQLRLRIYHGNDKFNFETGSSFKNNIQWGNTTASLQWLHKYNANIIGELTVGKVLYNMDFGASIASYGFKIFSDITDNNISYRLDYFLNNHVITTGLIYTHHSLRPNNVSATSGETELQLQNNVRLYGEEASFYINDNYKISEKLEVNAGVRLSAFIQRGPFTRYIVDEGLQILDTVSYTNRKIISHYINPEPRISLRYALNESSSIKISYDRSFQYMHMAPVASASLPMDVWVTSSTKVKPQSANQYSVGYFRNFLNNTIETSIVTYHKTMNNQLEYRDGVIIGYSKGFNYDDNFVFGKGQSYGAEFLVKKNTGRLNGTVAYTLSRTTRKFNDLNDGKRFPAKYDRLHDVSIMANYHLNKKWAISSVFVYGTGNALNLPVARYVIQGNVVNEYRERNAFRMPAYHRMDVALTYTSKKTERFEASWILSIYNVYNRRNPYYIYFESTGDIEEYSLKTDLKQVSLFPILPSITYRFKF